KKLFRHVFRQQEPEYQKSGQPQAQNNLPSVAAMTAAAPAPAADKWKNSGQPYQDPTSKQWLQPQVDASGAMRSTPMPQGFQPKAPHLDDYEKGLRRYGEAAGGDPEHPTGAEDEAFRKTRAGIAAAGSATQISLEAYGSAFDPPVKWADMTPQQKAYYPSWKAMQGLLTTTHQRVQMVTQRNGDTLPVIVQDTTQRGNLSGVPKPPGLGGGGGVLPSSSGSMTTMGKPEGLKVPGNINLNNRPILHNADKTISSERSFSIGTDQGEVLIPRIYDGKDHTEQEAIQHYKQTGQHMGIFDTPEHADAYAQQVHNRKLTTPRPPGQQKKDLQGIVSKSKPKGAGVVSVGDKPIGGKNTAPQNKADTEYNEAVSLASIADQVAKKPDDAVNIKGFAIALERARAGRFTTQALDVMLDAGWGNKLEQWANKPTSGSLPSDIIRQLVDGAHENLAAKKAAKDAAFAESGATSGE